jgi:uncharacterized protein YggE
VSGEIAVVGEGKVDIVPDLAQISAGITIENVPTVEEAEKRINEVNNKIIEAVARLGIDKEDIKTSNYSINPAYEFIPTGGRSEISGYSGNATVTISVRNQDLLARVITAATEAGANNVYNAGFSIDDPSKYREEARKKAIENAKDQAQKLASELGIGLGRVVNIVESTPGGIPQPMYLESKRLDAGGAVPPDIEPGSQTITSQVTLYFERK